MFDVRIDNPWKPTRDIFTEESLTSKESSKSFNENIDKENRKYFGQVDLYNLEYIYK